MWTLGGAVNALRVSSHRIALICTVVDLLHARAYGGMSLNPMAMTHMQWTEVFWDTFERHGQTNCKTLTFSCFVSCMLVRCLFLSEFVLPANVKRWKHKFGFHNRGVMWDAHDKRGRGGE